MKIAPWERISTHCLALTKIRREINKELQDSTLFYGQFFSWWKTSKASPGHLAQYIYQDSKLLATLMNR